MDFDARVERVAMAIVGSRSVSEDAAAFWRAFEAWGIWANGGFEAIFTGTLGDEVEAVIQALHHVGASAHARLFEQGVALFPGGVVPPLAERDDMADELCDRLSEDWHRLDTQMQSLPNITQPLAAFLEDKPNLIALGE